MPLKTLDQAFEWLAQNKGRIDFQKPDECTTKLIMSVPIPKHPHLHSLYVTAEYGALIPAEGILERLVDHVDALKTHLEARNES
jgi:hypothetical protein